MEIESFVAGHAEAQLRLRQRFAPARPGLRQRFAGQLKKPVKVDGSPDRIAEQVEPCRFERTGGEAEVALRQSQPFVARHAAEQRRQPGRRERTAQQFRMPRGADVVRDHPRDPDGRMPSGKTAYKRRNRPGHAARVDDEDDRQFEQRGDLRAAAFERGRRIPVEEPHDPLDHGGIRTGRMTCEAAADPFRTGQESVEIDRGPFRSLPVKQRVDVIRPAFERRNRKAARAERTQDTERQRGFSAAGIGPRDQETRHATLRTHVSPGNRGDSRNGRPGRWLRSCR